MKSRINREPEGQRRSPPSRGAWIEIAILQAICDFLMSPPSRGAWIEIRRSLAVSSVGPGRPPRGGRGLKSFRLGDLGKHGVVAPLAGGVD